MNVTFFVCSICNKKLKRGEKEHAEKTNNPICAECNFHIHNNSFTIENYNKWLRKVK